MIPGHVPAISLDAAEKQRPGIAVLKFGLRPVTITHNVSSFTLVNAIMIYSRLRSSSLVVCTGFVASTLSVAGAQTQRQAQAQSQAKAQTKAQTQTQQQSQTQSQAQSQVQAQTNAQAQPKAQTQTNVQTQGQGQTQPQPKPQAQTRPRYSTGASAGRRAGSMIPAAPAPPRYVHRGRSSATRPSADKTGTPHTETYGRHDSAGHSVGFYPSTQGQVRPGSQPSAYRMGKRSAGRPH
jgi:hypothetical protein